jgi:HD-like signal output (HDOD) protein
MLEAVLDPALQRRLHIPPRPEVVCVLQEEARREAPDLARIARAISADVSLAGAMLRTVNSPALGLARKVSAIPQAISLLGLRNVAGLATALVLRNCLGETPSMERFWDTAEKTALLCAHLAQRLRGIAPDEAYTAGLFHDCGIPILMRFRANYKLTLARANKTADRRFADVEMEDVGTHHGAVGYFLARSWDLPDALCQAILWHHDTGAFGADGVTDTVRNYIGIIHLAEHIQHRMVRNSADLEWAKFEGAILDHFALTEEDFINLLEDARDLLCEEA